MRGWVALSTPEDFGGKALSEIIWTEMFFRTLRYSTTAMALLDQLAHDRPAAGGG
jgi:hypothetical protein